MTSFREDKQTNKPNRNQKIEEGKTLATDKEK